MQRAGAATARKTFTRTVSTFSLFPHVAPPSCDRHVVSPVLSTDLILSLTFRVLRNANTVRSKLKKLQISIREMTNASFLFDSEETKYLDTRLFVHLYGVFDNSKNHVLIIHEEIVFSYFYLIKITH